MSERDWSPILIVVAHPDDEVLGTGIQLQRWDPSRLTILHLTDGSPKDPKDRKEAGFEDPEEYAHARRRELYAALDLVGIRPDQCMNFKYTDQETVLHLPEIKSRLMALLSELRPGVIYTHPYEGGHPDHDSAALIVGQAAEASPEMECTVMEFTSYHRENGRMVTGEFLGGGETETIEPTEQERELKCKMLACYQTQQKMLSQFPVGAEKFRPAPHYDFTKPPHEGPLHYETLGWDISGELWRSKL